MSEDVDARHKAGHDEELASRGNLFPDKVTTPPSPRRGTVRFSPILHDELTRRAAAAG
jgi:hypothetical protein